MRELEERFPKIRQWESEVELPTLRQLEGLAKKTLTPVGFLLLSEPPDEELPIPSFRTTREGAPPRPSPNLLDTVYAMLRRQDWMRDDLIETGHDFLPFVGSARSDDPPAVTAKRVRQTIGLSSGWAGACRSWTEALALLMRKAESVGILVMASGIVGNATRRPLDADEFRGFVLADSYAPLVFINAADFKAAQMFTLAHELAHVWFARSAAFDLRELKPSSDRLERLCDTVAAEFLLPAEELQEMWPELEGAPEPFERIARGFRVSSIVAARRALDLGLINRDGFLDFYRAYRDAVRGRAKPTGGDFYATQEWRIGRRFGGAVLRAANEGRLLYRDAYRLTGLRGEAFDEYSRRVAVGGELA
jgi:Zn-dependent peptidase ImmA (M78 family)